MNDYNPEYDDEAGMADNNLETLKKAVEGIDSLISPGDNLPEWCQEKIAVATSMLVTIWNYMQGEEERGVSETKRSHKRPKYSLKAKNSTLDPIKPAKSFDVKPSKKKHSYFEHLEDSLNAAINENRDMKNWDQTPGRIMPAAESVKGIKVRREQDEWVVSIKGTFIRIPVDEAPSPEDAVAAAKSNLGMGEAREMSPALRAAQQNLINLKNKKAEKPTKVAHKSAFAASEPREKTRTSTSVKPQAIVAKGGQIHDPEMEKMLQAFLAKGGEIKKGRPGKAPPVGRNQASKHIGGGGKYRKKSDTPGQGANYRGNKEVAVESKWTHDTLAARLFEQDVTYEDELNRKLKGKLGK